MKKIHPYARLISIVPTRKGFAFAVLEGPRRLLDWGSARVWAENDKEFLARVEGLVQKYRAVQLVLQETSDRRNSPVAIRRLKKLVAYAAKNGLGPLTASKAEIRKTFSTAGSKKREIAAGIAEIYPELEPFLPPERKPWHSEHDRSHVFDAVALILTVVWREAG
ncbi:MAG: hypothetical protein WEG36_10970 [Gemmatimonadota bacterium]